MLAPPPLPRTLEASIRDLGSTKPQVRASAIADLARHATSNEATRARAIPLFEKALHDDTPGVRSAAAVALADLAAHEALPALLVAVEDADQHVRQMALSALGEIGDARARQRIERALADARPEVRYQALIAFARIAKSAPSDVAAALEHAMTDKDDAIRYIALRIAEEHAIDSASLNERAHEALADTHDSVALAAALFLARPLARPIAPPLTHPSRRTDAAIADAKKTIAKLIAGGMRKPEREDEQAALELSGELGMREAIGDLERRAWGLGRMVRETCEWHAKIALARMGHPRAMSEILADLGSWRRETRQAAVVAVGRARMSEARAKIEALKDGEVDPALVAAALDALDGADADARVAPHAQHESDASDVNDAEPNR
jgi:HEAT repeat protein